MPLDSASTNELLHLHARALIASNIAERQTEVVRKAFNYLTASENHKVVYIADEVGLGKTYIALGIAMLLRHFSQEKTMHRDLVLVPKANLQRKWADAAKSFVQNNYRGNRTDIAPLFDVELNRERLQTLLPDAAMTIFRMTSFSSLAAKSSRRARLPLLERLKEQVGPDKWALQILDKAWTGHLFENERARDLLCLAAYLLNALSGRVNTLIVDEAHNYRHGIDSSFRNLATACFLGVHRHEAVLKAFPELEKRLHFPLADKTICLSATPKDRDLWEIARQLDCLTAKHPLAGVSDPDEFRQRLKSFLIRGNLTYDINGQSVSRHECRSEHRQGHVDKNKSAEWLDVPNDFMGAFWQLIQYQSIKHLRAKGNTTFEMGMLAGFETYHLDAQKIHAAGNMPATDRDEDDTDTQKEYEQTATREIRESEDRQVIETLVRDFQKKFGEPPHPKQTPLTHELGKQMFEQQEKSLVFVRRVHTATELSGRLLREYERRVAEDLRRFFEKTDTKPRFPREFWRFASDKLTDLLKEFEMKDVREEVMAFFRDGKLLEKIKAAHGFGWFERRELEGQLDFCFFAFKNNETVQDEVKRLRERKKWHINEDFWKALREVGKSWQMKRIENPDADDDSEGGDELESAYFFNDYFRKGRPGKFFRNKMYRKKSSGEQLFSLPDDPQTNDNGFLSRLLHETCAIEFARWKARESYCPEDWQMLSEILKGIFRNGTGLLPAFLADSAKSGAFADNLLLLLRADAPFAHVAEEVRTILLDFDLLMSVNFGQQTPGSIHKYFRMLSPVVSRTGMTGADRSIVAAQFRMPGFPYVLVATDIFREGEDLHTYCQNVYHYGIAWNPSDMEQRTGRIDRINSLSHRKLIAENSGGNCPVNQVQVFYPYLRQSVEVNQVTKLFGHINRFIETFNEIELTLKRESQVALDVPVSEGDILPLLTPVRPKRGYFEVEDFIDFSHVSEKL
ncbi:MAG: DEAD/DEAH box helicase [Saprospiraceae bacterium]|nr:DEAD/DEAH box helicase [Saprospiraceae bacterium]